LWANNEDRSEEPLTIPENLFSRARRRPTAWRFRSRSNIPVNHLKEIAVSLKLPRPHSPSNKNLKTSFQLVMVFLGFVILIASLRDKRIKSDSLSSFTKEGQR
jgi:hypothetical protein